MKPFAASRSQRLGSRRPASGFMSALQMSTLLHHLSFACLFGTRAGCDVCFRAYFADGPRDLSLFFAGGWAPAWPKDLLAGRLSDWPAGWQIDISTDSLSGCA
eukprot:1398057-Pyramimonas_sp.AAC.1